jgi:D-sedoheptulose 7-phosphate isomerase
MRELETQIADLVTPLQQLGREPFAGRVRQAIDLIVATLRVGKPVLVCGNGGSAADALHISGELVGRFFRERRGLPVICLSANASVLTAWANDVSFESVFARQVEAFGQPGSVLWCLSTSGRSKNVIAAADAARQLGLSVIAMTGEGGGLLAALSDVLLDVPSRSTPRIQEMHTVLYHFICERVEDAVADGDGR